MAEGNRLSLWRGVLSLAKLRLILFARGRQGRKAFGVVLSATVLLSVSAGAGLATRWLFAGVDAVRWNPLWIRFFAALVAFLLSLFWILWPVVAAHIDESSEMSRFHSLPLRPRQVYLLHTFAAAVEPATVLFYGVLLGLCLGLSDIFGMPPAALACVVAFCAMNICFGRMMQGLFLNLMSSRRAGEALVGGFLLLLLVGLVVPPMDLSWLQGRFSLTGMSSGDLEVISSATLALEKTPAGWLAAGMLAAMVRDGATAISLAAGMALVAAGAWIAGLYLMLNHWRGGWFAGTARGPSGRIYPLGTGTPSGAGIRMEVKKILSNPKGKLALAVPFYLVILLKLLGGFGLAEYAWGPKHRAYIWSAVALYQLVVLGGLFFANLFGYDGPAARLVFLLPRRPRTVLLERNAACALVASVQFATLGIVVGIPLHHGGASLPLLGYPAWLCAALAAGNYASVVHPVRFHHDMSRRDRLPAASNLVLVAAISAAASVTALTNALPPAAGLVGMCALCAFSAAAWWKSLALSERLLLGAREGFLQQLLRE